MSYEEEHAKMREEVRANRERSKMIAEIRAKKKRGRRLSDVGWFMNMAPKVSDEELWELFIEEEFPDLKGIEIPKEMID